MKNRIFAVIFVMVFLLLVAGCARENTSPSKAELAARYGIEESVIDRYHTEHPQIKRESMLTLGDYEPGKVIICVYPYANEYAFKSSDFSEVGCVSVREHRAAKKEEDRPTRYLILTLEEEWAVSESVSILQERADIYWVGVNTKMTIS